MSDVMDSALNTLATFLAANVTGLTVLQEWPYGNQKLSYPSLTIATNLPKRTPIMPVFISKSLPDIDNKIVVKEAVAEWEDTFQMDLWCRNKLERKQFSDAIIAAFNSQAPENPDGLSLSVTDQNNEVCRFELVTSACIDDEAAAQRQERREKITVLVNCREIRSYNYYAMITVEVHNQEITGDIVDDDSDTETYTATT